jgi:hypothetical protein
MYPPLPPLSARSPPDTSSLSLQLNQQLFQQQLQQQQFEFEQRQRLSRLGESSWGMAHVAANCNLHNNAQRLMEDPALSMGFRLPDMRLRDVQPPLRSISGRMDLDSHFDIGRTMLDSSAPPLRLLRQQQGLPFSVPLQQSFNISTAPAAANFAFTDDRMLHGQRSLGQQNVDATSIKDHLRAALDAVEVPLPSMLGSVVPSSMSAISPLQGDSANTNRAQSSAAPASTVFPAIMACPTDGALMSEHQSFLRLQIHFFRAKEADINAPVRGRNRPVQFNQIGIRCRYCAHVPASQRRNGSTYFPASTLGLCVDSPCYI